MPKPKDIKFQTPQKGGQPPVKRQNMEMDPESPVSVGSLRAVIAEFMIPVQEDIVSIQKTMDIATAKLDSIAVIKDQVEALSLENEQLKASVKDMEIKVNENTAVRQVIESEMLKLSAENKSLKDHILTNECQSRLDNLLFIGVGES